MVIELDKSIRLKSFQKEMINKATDYKKRNLVVCAARQTGKSFSLRIIALKWLCETTGCTVGYFSLTAKMCKYFYSLVLKIIPKTLLLSSNSSTLEICLTNGSNIRFYSLEPTAVGNIRGTTLDFCIVDEAAFMSQKTPDGQLIWEEIISPMLDAKCRKCTFVSTPHGKQGVFYSFVLKCYTNSANYDFIRNTIYDDETKDAEWIEAKKAEMSDNSFRQEYCCEFIDGGASFFKDYEKCFCLADSASLKGPIVAGIDWSSTGEDNTILTLMDRNGYTKQFLIEGSFDDKYKKIGDILNGYKEVAAIYAEKNSIGAVMINELKKHTIHRSKIKEFNTTNQSKNDIINSLARDMEQKELSFDKSNELLKSELGTFTYTISQNGNTIMGALQGFHDDTVMSAAICNYARKTSLRSSGPKVLGVPFR